MMTIVDYGMGNLRSVQKAFEHVGVCAEIATAAAEVAAADALVLPGVGAFRDAIAELRRQDLVGPIADHAAADKPFLGICLGLQLLFDASEEDGDHSGLGIVPGRVVRFENVPGLKVPHMGWNRVEPGRPSPLFDGLPADPYFYFVHSYHVVPEDESVVAGWTEYGGRFASAIRRGRLLATQFHPEKSQRDGLALLRNFAALAGEPVCGRVGESAVT